MRKDKQTTVFDSVMLIDDNEIDNFINQKMIEGCCFAQNVFIHTSSRSALEFLQNLERNHEKIPENMLPGMIFLDINMPIMDGFQFVEQFANLKASIRDRMKIVMLSTSINPNDMIRSEESPYILRFINKPLNEKLLDELAEQSAKLKNKAS
ncbi:MAG: response regulator [Flavobacteriales bacterium]